MADVTQAQAMELDEGALCSECNEVPGELRRLKKLYCSKCWIYHCDFRFRKRLYELGKPQKGLTGTSSSFGSSMQSVDSAGTGSSSGRPSLPLENVLVDYDAASEHSIALLYLLRDAVTASLEADAGTDHPKTLPFPFSFTILFVSAGVHENGEINPNKRESLRVKNFERLKSWYKETKTLVHLGPYFPSIVVTSLEESLAVSKDNKSEVSMVDIAEDVDTKVTFPLNPSMHEKLVALIENLRTKTSRIDLLQILRRNLTEVLAERLRLSKVLVLEDQTNLAVKMFSMMSIGRGAQLADEMNFITKGAANVLFARPLKDLSCEDLRDYVKCKKLIELSKAEPDVKNIDNIKSQCEDFVKTLQRGFPATVPTLTKIGGKLEPTCNEAENVTPATHSKCIDIKYPTHNLKLCSLCKNVRDNDEPRPIEAKSLCYACSRIMQEMKTPDLLLEFLSHQ